jgi:hypothetical protein
MKVTTGWWGFCFGIRDPFIGKTHTSIRHQDIGLGAGQVEEALNGRNIQDGM